MEIWVDECCTCVASPWRVHDANSISENWKKHNSIKKSERLITEKPNKLDPVARVDDTFSRNVDENKFNKNSQNLLI